MNPRKHTDIAIIGAGILGLAHAYHFARAGLKVSVFERSQLAVGASVRNFGMVWPVGQPPGEMRDIALRSREVWLDVLSQAGIWHQQCGSLHLAYHEDEMGVLEEFFGMSSEFGYECQLIQAAEVLEKSSVVKKQNLMGGLWSPSELCVFPRQVIRDLPAYLQTLGVDFHFATAVSDVRTGMLQAGEHEVSADRIVLCTGDDFASLFPAQFRNLGMTRSKLQMMRMKHRNRDFKIGPHLCAGLTLGHYSNFKVCNRLPALLKRYRDDWPDQVQWGIHLLVSQHEDGCLTVGDSHEYGLSVDPFLRQEIDQFILDYLSTFLDTSELDVVERWYGVYSKHPEKAYVAEEIMDKVHVVTGVGGAGMTLSFGLAERQAKRIMS